MFLTAHKRGKKGRIKLKFRLNYLSDELHDLSQVLLLLQDLLGLGTQGHKLREVLVVILIQSTSVFAVADQPVHRGEVLPLSQLLIQTPEHLRANNKSEELSAFK